ncbi:MAG: polysaccharide biosynthesis/export family protein [Sedimentisphaerales bacterium]|nr:polysaccharide biosynthesis/export family protein [Sedimentisphaerales bacterium]
MFQAKHAIRWIWAVMLLGMTWAGCDGPDTIGRFRAVPITNIILDELGVVDEESSPFAIAREPQPRDLMPDETEYVIGPGDVLDISVYELFGPGQEWVGRRQVSETGRITIPEIGTFRANGKTELELTETIKQLLSPRLLKDPTVTVLVSGPRKKVYTVSGAISAPGPYMLNENDYRISNALASAGGIPQINADYAYIIRTPSAAAAADQPTPAEQIWRRPTAEPARKVPPAGPPAAVTPVTPQIIEPVPAPPAEEPTPPTPPTQPPRTEQEELIESITPMTVLPSPASVLGGGSLPATFHVVSPASASRFLQQAARSSLAAAAVDPPAGEGASLGDWRVVRQGDHYTLVPPEGVEPVEAAGLTAEGQASSLLPEMDSSAFALPAGPPQPPGGYVGWEDDRMAAFWQQEVIRVDLRRLRGGDFSQNVVILPGDDIQVPYNSTGIYSVMGQVSRPGAYSLVGQRLTLKQAIATAGPLSALAWPSRCEIIRRIGENKEVTYLVNLDKLFAGTAPDLFVKPNDIINVGSHPVARWLAVLRQSFRSTYGFGFVYDRNFADVDFGH